MVNITDEEIKEAMDTYGIDKSKYSEFEKWIENDKFEWLKDNAKSFIKERC